VWVSVQPLFFMCLDFGERCLKRLFFISIGNNKERERCLKRLFFISIGNNKRERCLKRLFFISIGNNKRERDV
jgi:hypothetical protein